MSEEIMQVDCSNCGAPLDYRQGDAVAYCVYCNTVNKLREEKTYNEQYMLDISIKRESVRKFMIGDLLKIPGIPENINHSLQIIKMDLIYEPYYVTQVHGNLKWAGMGKQASFSSPYKGAYRHISFHTEAEQGEFDDRANVIVYAGESDNPTFKKYKIATKGRKFFSKGEIKQNGGNLKEEQMTFEEAERFAVDSIHNKHLGLLREELEQVTDEIQDYSVAQNQRIHVPIWHITWKIGSGGDTYTTIIDAASGLTLQTDMPRSKTFIVVFLTVGLAFLLLGLVPFLLVGNAFVVSMVFGLILALQTWWKNRPRKYEERED